MAAPRLPFARDYTREEAQAALDRFFQRYPTMEAWMARIRAEGERLKTRRGTSHERDSSK